MHGFLRPLKCPAPSVRSVKGSFDLSFAMFNGMGSILTSTVDLIFAAAFFAKGLQNIGIVDLLMSGAQSIGLDYTETSVVLSAIIGIVTVLTGSGVSGFAITMVKRTIIPCLTGYVVMLITVNLIV